MVHPTLGPAPYFTMCKKYFRNDLKAPIAKPSSKSNCKECLKEYARLQKRVHKEYKKYVEALEYAA